MAAARPAVERSADPAALLARKTPALIVVKPNELPFPLGRAVMMLPLLSQVGDVFQVELIFWGGVMVTVTIQVLVPETLMVAL